MTDNKIRNMKAEIHSVTPVFEGGPFKVVKLSTSHESYEDGRMIRHEWYNFERGDAAAVILYKRDTNEIVLVRQFRAPTLRYHEQPGGYRPRNDGQLDETVAGMPSPGESIEDCAIREALEETGYILEHNQLEKIAEFYSSPGGSSERIHLYYAEVTDQHRDPERDQNTGGDTCTAESMLVRHIPVGKFFAQTINSREPLDSKVLIASMLLRLRKIPIESASPEVRRYALKDKPNCAIVLRTGHMKEIKDVDAWVNSETTDMEMDRFTAKSVSAYIRYAGALKDDQGHVIEDTIADALKGEMRRITKVGDVYCTTSGRLKKSHKVKCLFHVAAVHGVINKGTHVLIAEIEPTTKKVLDAIERRNKKLFRSKCGSVLLPMFGTGEAGLPAEDAVRHMLRGIFSFFHDTDAPILQEVHISAFQESDAFAADKCLRELGGRVIQPNQENS